MARPSDEVLVAAGLPGALKQARAGLTQDEVTWVITDDSNAEKPVISQSAVSKLESGQQQRISQRVLSKVEAFLASRGVTIDDIDNRPAPPESATSPTGVGSVVSASPAAIAELAAEMARQMRATHFHTDRQARALDRLDELLGRPGSVQLNEWEYRGMRDELHAEGVELAPPM